MDSQLPGFYKLSPAQRLAKLKEAAGLTEEEAAILKKAGPLPMESADIMIENVVGTTGLPFGIATNFRINGNDVLIPMAVEEPSIVAAASNVAKLCRPGGFTATADEPVMIGQVQLVKIPDLQSAAKKILSKKTEILDLCNRQDSMLVSLGGGAKGLETHILQTPAGPMLIVHILVDVRDAMGANAVNTMCERASTLLEELTGGEARLRIISNLADKRLARAKAVWTSKALEESLKGLGISGEEIVSRILEAYEFAAHSPHRAATHNKGIMNGIDAVVIATGNDFRAVEAGAHSYASISGRYLPLTRYSKTAEGDLLGEIELPIAVGTVGGTTRTHPVAKIALKILGTQKAQELAKILAAVGLAQNFAALRALATEGIQKGHMRLHAKNLAVLAGAKGNAIATVASQMVSEGKITASRAKEILEGK